MNDVSSKKNFLFLISGVTVSTFGNALYSIAIGIWALQATGSEMLMGILASITYLISFFIEPIAGAVADFMESRNLMIWADAIQGITVLVIARLAYCESLSLVAIILLSIVASFCNAVFTPASSVLFLRIVSQAKLVSSQSKLRAARAISQLMAETISASLILWLGLPFLFLFNGLSFLLSALSEFFITKDESPRKDIAPDGESGTIQHILKELKTGLIYILTQKKLCSLIFVCLEMNLLTAGFTGVLYAWILEKQFSLLQYSFFLGVQSGCTLIAMLLLATVQLNEAIKQRVLKYAILFNYTTFLLAMILRSFFAVIVCIGIASFTNAIIGIIVNENIFVVIAPEHRGKTMGTLNAVLMLGTGVSMLLYGLFSEWFCCELICVIAALAMVFPYAQFWNVQKKR